MVLDLLFFFFSIAEFNDIFPPVAERAGEGVGGGNSPAFGEGVWLS